MDKKSDKVPFYKELYYKVEKELGPIDTLVGLGLGAVSGVAICCMYWRHAWKNH